MTKFDPVPVQQSLDVIRVTFMSEEDAVLACRENRVRLFGLWCRMDGGPLATIIHLFDCPYEEDEEPVKDFFSQFGFVKTVRNQKYLSKPNIYTGTRLVDVVLNNTPPRTALIGGHVCGLRVNLSFATFAMCKVINLPLVSTRTSVVCVGSLCILPAIVPIHGERHREPLGRSLESP